MAKEEVKLLGFWVSPFVFRVQWALKLKGVEFEYIEEDLFVKKSDLLLKSNPINEKVPVLIHKGKPILESFIILEYIDETWKQNPILPTDPYERAMARFWAKFGEEKVLDPAWIAMCGKGEKRDNGVKLTIESLAILDGEIKGKKFFGGEAIGYLDFALAWIAYWLEVWEEVGCFKVLDPIRFPSLTSWMKNLLDFPIIKEGLPPRDKMVVYFNERRQILASFFD